MVIGIAVIGKDIVARPVSSRPPNDRNVLLAEKIAGDLYLRPVLQLKSNMMHFRALAAHEIHSVMIRSAAHEDKPILDPVRDAKAQNAAIKIGKDFGIVDAKCQMAELERPNTIDWQVLAERHRLRE